MMRILMSAVSSLSEDVIFSLFIVAITLVLGYIFYPAISLSLADSIAIDQETVSHVITTSTGMSTAAACLVALSHIYLSYSAGLLFRIACTVVNSHSRVQ